MEIRDKKVAKLVDFYDEIKAIKRQQYQKTYKAIPRNRLRSLATAACARAKKQKVPVDKEHLYELAEFPPRDCKCCGKEIDYEHASKRSDAPSLDKVQPHKGYVRGNIAIICGKCNTQKQDCSLADLQRIIKYIRSFN